MAVVSFYQMQSTPLEKTLPRVLEKVLSSGARALVWCGSLERLKALDASLWTYASQAFLPHGAAPDFEPVDQPIWLTQEFENKNNSTVLVALDDQVAPDLAGFARTLDFYNGNDSDALALANERQQHYKACGHDVEVFHQNDAGAWHRA